MSVDLPGHGTVETHAAPFMATLPQDEWLARDLPGVDAGNGRSRSLRACARGSSASPTTPNCGYLMTMCRYLPLPAACFHELSGLADSHIWLTLATQLHHCNDCGRELNIGDEMLWAQRLGVPFCRGCSGERRLFNRATPTLKWNARYRKDLA